MTLKKKTRATTQTASGKSEAIHENNNYYLVVGIPPATKDFPSPIASYLVVNKAHGVIEYWHSVLFYAKQHADFLSDLLDGKHDDPIVAVVDPQPPKAGGMFN